MSGLWYPFPCYVGKNAQFLFPITSVQTQQFMPLPLFCRNGATLSPLFEQFPHSSVATGGGTPSVFQRRPTRREVRRRSWSVPHSSPPPLFASLNVAPRGHEYYRHTLFDNSLTQDAYFYSSGKASAPSSLELVNGKLPSKPKPSIRRQTPCA